MLFLFSSSLKILSCLTHGIRYKINVTICHNFLVYLVLLRFVIIRNFLTFLTTFNFSVFLLNLEILIFVPCTQTGPFLCLVLIFFVMIFEHVGDVLICWVLQIGEFNGNLYELYQTSNPKRTIHPLFKMFLVDLPSFPVDRREKDLCLKLYFRLLERRTIKFEVNFDLCSL